MVFYSMYLNFRLGVYIVIELYKSPLIDWGFLHHMRSLLHTDL